MQQKKVGVPGIIGAICSFIVLVFDFKMLVDLFGVIDQVTSSEAPYFYCMVVACVEMIIGYAMVGVGVIQRNYKTMKTGFNALGSGCALDIFTVVLIFERAGVFRYANSEAKTTLFGVVVCAILVSIGYFFGTKVVKNVSENRSIKTMWFVPGVFFVANLFLQLVLLGEITGDVSSAVSDIDSFAMLQTICILGMLFLVGLELYLHEKPDLFANMNQPRAYGGQQYGQPQQPMYGGQQYGQPQQPMYGGQYGQPQQPMYGGQYGQPQQPMYGGQQYGQPQQPMYGQPTGQQQVQNNGQNNPYNNQ